jgi:predicted transposase YdaD
VIVIFTEKRFDQALPRHYQEYADSGRLQRIYLDKLPPETSDRSLGLGLLTLLGTKQKDAPAKGRALIERTRQELADVTNQRNFIELVETVFVYKFPELTFGEVGEMLGLGDLKQTRAYQEAREQERIEMLEKMVPLLLESGVTVEQIAMRLNLPIEAIQPFVPETK